LEAARRHQLCEAIELKSQPLSIAYLIVGRAATIR